LLREKNKVKKNLENRVSMKCVSLGDTSMNIFTTVLGGQKPDFHLGTHVLFIMKLVVPRKTNMVGSVPGFPQ